MTDAASPLTRRGALGLIGAAALSPRVALAAGGDALSGRAFGTNWRLAGPPGRDLARLGPALARLFAGIDGAFSPWRADSALSRFNAAGAGLHAVPPDLAEVAEAALQVAAQSGGAFDPTVGPLVARWGFGPITGGAPEWSGLSAGAGGLAKTRAGLTLDLCGIAKGWALDRAAELAREAGHRDLLLDLGGELVALGTHPAGRDWRVAVQSPLPARPSPAALRLPPGVAIATSGTGWQSYALNGQTYGHIIDPASRTPAAGNLRSVTVAASDAMTADAWATALFAAGDAGGPELARARDIAALFLIGDGNDLRQLRTGPIADLIL